MNNKEKGMGCLIVVLALIPIFGNVSLLMLLLGELEADNPAGMIMSVLAAIEDVVIIVYVLYSRIEKWAKRKKEQRISDAIQALNEFFAYYSPKKTVSLQETRKPSVDLVLVNQEVVYAVKRYKKALKEEILECNEVDQAISQILLCTGCANVDERLDYLSYNEDELQRLKRKSDSLHEEIDRRKIRLLNEDEELLFTVKKAFTDLPSSKKCVIEGVEIKEFICEEKPAELELFEYKYEPTVLHVGRYFWCLFSNVILLFDNKGIFATAVDPTALSIHVERVTETLHVWDNSMPPHPYISTDSKYILRGETRHTWLHTCRDGTPDLRYSHNPRREYRVDKYEYGRIEISLLGDTITINLSSETATDSFEKMERAYIRKCNNRHNPIPELMNLFYNLSEDAKGDVTYILNAGRGRIKESNYFCVID